MGIAESLRNIIDERAKELTGVGETKEIFNDIIQKCFEEAGRLKTSLVYCFPGYGYPGNKTTGYCPPVKKVVEMLEKEGFRVAVKNLEITHQEAYGPTPRIYWLGSNGTRDEAREIDFKVVGTEYYLEIEW